MHEASIANDVMEIIMERVNSDKDLQGKMVKSIKFSQSFPHTVVPDSFEFYFVELVKGTVLENAQLLFTESDNHGFFIDSIDVDE